MILKSTKRVLDSLTNSPSEFLNHCDYQLLNTELSDFKHRFTGGQEVILFLSALVSIQKDYKLIGNFFEQKMKMQSYPETLNQFVKEVLKRMNVSATHLLPLPEKGSACKRLHLFMRWMVREDEVDPGGWVNVPTSELIIPVDVHMHRIATKLGFTNRKAADNRTALEITQGFKRIQPEDPVKYDFSLTRYGIQQLTESELFRKLHTT